MSTAASLAAAAKQKQLRELMAKSKAAAQQAPAAGGRLTDRLAKYDATGGLSCAICKTPLMQADWSAHISSAKHIQTLEAFRELARQKAGIAPAAAAASSSTAAAAPAKSSLSSGTVTSTISVVSKPRPAVSAAPAPATTAAPVASAAPAGLPAGFFSSAPVAAAPRAAAVAPAPAAALSGLLSSYDDDDEDDASAPAAPVVTAPAVAVAAPPAAAAPAAAPAATASSLPKDFFESMGSTTSAHNEAAAAQAAGADGAPAAPAAVGAAIRTGNAFVFGAAPSKPAAAAAAATAASAGKMPPPAARASKSAAGSSAPASAASAVPPVARPPPALPASSDPSAPALALPARPLRDLSREHEAFTSMLKATAAEQERQAKVDAAQLAAMRKLEAAEEEGSYGNRLEALKRQTALSKKRLAEAKERASKRVKSDNGATAKPPTAASKPDNEPATDAAAADDSNPFLDWRGVGGGMS